MSNEKMIDILNSEMVLATGCTEPAAIAFTAAHAGKALAQMGAAPEALEVRASINMIKNAMAAGIPGTRYTGIGYAAAIGAFADPAYELDVFEHAGAACYAAAEALMNARKVTVGIAKVPQVLYIEVVARGGGHFARAVVADLHTNLILLETDQGALVSTQKEGGQAKEGVSPADIAATLSLSKIFSFADREFDPFGAGSEIIHKSVEINGAIAVEGMKRNYGLSLGKLLQASLTEKGLSIDLATNAMIRAAAGADARMAGAPLPVVTNSGSGNQGITATVPVMATAEWLGVGEEKMLRAVALSNLTAIYIKSKFGRLSALCGATVAGTGAACGIAYLMGGGEREIGYAIQNMIGNVTGMLCDGAKADCALKISSCTNAAVQSALMAMQGIHVASTDGIVEEDPERTIENIATLSRDCSHAIDDAVLQIMLSKEQGRA